MLLDPLSPTFRAHPQSADRFQNISNRLEEKTLLPLSSLALSCLMYLISNLDAYGQGRMPIYLPYGEQVTENMRSQNNTFPLLNTVKNAFFTKDIAPCYAVSANWCFLNNSILILSKIVKNTAHFYLLCRKQERKGLP